MKKLLFIGMIASIMIGCDEISEAVKENPLKAEYKQKWEKYRTLWYRSNFKQCFKDSSIKYSHLYDSIMGWKPIDVSRVDTVPVNETVDCN